MTIFSAANYPPKLRYSCYLTFIGVLGAVLLLLAGNNSLGATLLLCLPFVIIMPGIVLGRYRSYSWLSLMILMYFIMAITQAMAQGSTWMDTIYVGLTTVVFFSATFSSRWLQQHLREEGLQNPEFHNHHNGTKQPRTH